MSLFKKIICIAVVALAMGFAAALLPPPNVSVAQSNKAMLLPPHPENLIVEGENGPVEFSIEVADSELERARGLMFRSDLPKDRGMLFVFEETAQLGFWMRNTPLPLDLLFISESGRVVAIRRGVPFSDELISPIYPVRFVLELHQGTAAENRIKIGARLRHPLIDAISGAR